MHRTAITSTRDNPAVPTTPDEQVESTHEAYEAGASLVHIHVRNPDESPSRRLPSQARKFEYFN